LVNPPEPALKGAAESVSESNVAAVTSYIANQAEQSSQIPVSRRASMVPENTIETALDEQYILG